jgi:ubiquitin-protein ligase
MSGEEITQRLAAELELMRALAAKSEILEFEAEGDAPKEYKIKLRGKGIARTVRSGEDVELVDLHQIQVRFGYAYPERPPEIRWLTPIFHPNISVIGHVRLDDCGLPWHEEVTLDVVCQRLWDVARGAYVDLDKSNNYTAKKWFAQQQVVRLPVDHRALQGQAGPGPPPANVVRYQRGPSGAGPTSEEVLYIGDDTPAPPPPPPPRRPPPPRPSDDDDVLYIGD